MQTKQRIFKRSDMQVLHFFVDKTFDISHTLLPLSIAKLSTLNSQKSPSFWPTLYIHISLLITLDREQTSKDRN